jgi:hypothetical protein
MKLRPTAIGAMALLITTMPALHAANTPCSGKKGGISHCQGRTFVCNDGSVSASKKNCSATMGVPGLLQSEEMAPTVDKDCSCRSGQYCVGPKGGRYCIKDGGGKSYLRK